MKGRGIGVAISAVATLLALPQPQRPIPEMVKLQPSPVVQDLEDSGRGPHDVVSKPTTEEMVRPEPACRLHVAG